MASLFACIDHSEAERRRTLNIVALFRDRTTHDELGIGTVGDAFGRRIEKDVDGAITRYVYDGADILLEYDGAETLLARYTHGPGIDEPLIMERDLDSSDSFEATERFYYHADALGSVMELTDNSGAVRQGDRSTGTEAARGPGPLHRLPGRCRGRPRPPGGRPTGPRCHPWAGLAVQPVR